MANLNFNFDFEEVKERNNYEIIDLNNGDCRYYRPCC